MKTPTLLATIALTCGCLAASAPISRAAEEKGHAHHAKTDIAIPDTVRGIWTEINVHHRQLTEAIAAKKLAEADPHVRALDALFLALPAKSTDLPAKEGKLAAGMSKNACKACDDLDEAIDANKQENAEAKLKLLDGVLKILKAQYPPEISGAGQN